MFRENKKYAGSILAYGLVIMTVVLILLTSIIGFVTSQIKFSNQRIEKEKAFQIAEAGTYYYRWYLAHATSGMDVPQLRSFWADAGTLGVAGDYEADYLDPETHAVIGHYRIQVDPPDLYSTIASVTSTGWTEKMPNVTRTVKARFRRPSWSEYIYLVNDFVNFGSAARVYGKVHSNFGVRFDGIAYNSVTSHSIVFNDPSDGGQRSFGVHTHDSPADPIPPDEADYPWPDGTIPTRTDIFQGGRQLFVPEIRFDGVRTNLDDMKNQASAPSGTNINNCTSAGCYFDNTSALRIILKTNDTMDVCRVSQYDTGSLAITKYKKNSGSGECNSCSSNCAPTNYPIPDNGIIFVENNAWVEGTVDGKRLTIAAANLQPTGLPANIYLGMSNLRYTNHDGRDIIGLVGEKNIQIIRDCPEDFIIDGALIAQAKSGVGKVYRSSELYNSSSYNKDSLTINGSIASYQQPYFNSGSYGFANRAYNFDNNLLYYPPPYFPTGTEYSIDLWEEL